MEVQSKLKILAARIQSPCLSSTEIANTCAVTQQYVSQVLLRANLPTRSNKEGRPLCPKCLNPIPSKRKAFCSRKCQRSYGYIPIACARCNTIKLYKENYVIAMMKRNPHRHFFCSLSCRSKWYGALHYRRKSKYDADKIAECRSKGMTYAQIGQTQNVPIKQIGVILNRRIKDNLRHTIARLKD